jgi:hypothetical protein
MPFKQCRLLSVGKKAFCIGAVVHNLAHTLPMAQLMQNYSTVDFSNAGNSSIGTGAGRGIREYI